MGKTTPTKAPLLDCKAEMLEIRRRSKKAEFSYELNDSDRKTFIEIIQQSKDLEPKDLRTGHYLYDIISILQSTIDKELARELNVLLEKTRFKSGVLEMPLRANLMRIAGF